MSKKHKVADYNRKQGFFLFLMVIPFLVVVFLFHYKPLWGWRTAFYYYKPGLKLEDCEFVGWKWFTLLFSDKFYLRELKRVMKNTLGMNFLSMGLSWVGPLFAVFLAEIHSSKYKRVIQTLTTLPNFISWVLVYSIAFALFSYGDGLVNNILRKLGLSEGIDFLADPNHLWVKMWLWGSWKGLGWGAITYLAAIAGIDQQLYEAAMVDGASRMQRILHITIPGIVPTYIVLLVLSVGNMINNGIEQTMMFSNAFTIADLETLDYYVYNQGVIGGQYSYTTAVGIMKSFISIALMMAANWISKLVRGSTVV